jgi:hypothetical protein
VETFGGRADARVTDVAIGSDYLRGEHCGIWLNKPQPASVVEIALLIAKTAG